MVTDSEALDFGQVLATSPRLRDWYLKSFYGGVFAAGNLPRRLKELVRLRLSRRHGCGT